MSYRGLKVVVTGGAGFIGSNLSLRLLDEGACLTVIDNLIPGCGGKQFHLKPLEDRAKLIWADIGERTSELEQALASADVIFNLAGEISHIHSMQFPERDLQVNTVSQLRFLLQCAEQNPGVRVVYAGTRQVYGVPKYLPIDEKHPIQPVDFNGIHKYAATMYHEMLSRAGNLDAVVLRLTNVYGPRMAIEISCQGVLSNFLRRALLGEQIEVFGDGQQFRDPVYIDDAVDAFLLAGTAPKHSASYNVGGPEALSLLTIAKVASETAGSPPPVLRPFPAERKVIDIGSYRSDSSKICRELGWSPRIHIEEGMKRTLAYFSEHLNQYLGDIPSTQPCPMPEHRVPHRLTYGVVR
ncbi:MAG TPA: NAD-dependent epimerase/dehydratase family protein [Bryobacteraceae bacterium]|jgi:UDP-glucose 4-epimerase|nr:NAD-dependent epimerase/dehydratase family protein [Bryobacteraceae bacterium]